MRPVNIKRLNYKDEVARRHRRLFVFKIIAAVLVVIIVVAGLIYLFFFSKLFDIREVSFNGLDTVSSEEFKRKIEERLNQKILGYLPQRNDIFFVNAKNLETEIASAHPIFKSVDVQKKLLHGLVFNFQERKPAGIWCFTSISSVQANGCSYFDDEKVLWGQPSKSSGFIFLTVDDHRLRKDSASGGGQTIDEEFFRPIMETAKSLAGQIKNIVIPADSFSEFQIYTAEYYIIFTIESDIQNQLDVLRIFLKEKSKDSSFRPQYIDLRIDGRVYYR